MISEAVQQAAAVLDVAGLEERDYSAWVIDQVGEMGRKMGGSEADVKPAGSVEMF
jgi:hypothetical protein